MVESNDDKDVLRNSKSERAWDKLDDAISHMEQVVKNRPQEGASEINSEELDELRKSNAALKDSNQTVSARLGGAINQLKSVLES